MGRKEGSGGSAGMGISTGQAGDTGAKGRTLQDCSRAARRSTQLKLRGQVGKEGWPETRPLETPLGRAALRAQVRGDTPVALRQAAAPWVGGQ